MVRSEILIACRKDPPPAIRRRKRGAPFNRGTPHADSGAYGGSFELTRIGVLSGFLRESIRSPVRSLIAGRALDARILWPGQQVINEGSYT